MSTRHCLRINWGHCNTGHSHERWSNDYVLVSLKVIKRYPFHNSTLRETIVIRETVEGTFGGIIPGQEHPDNDQKDLAPGYLHISLINN